MNRVTKIIVAGLLFILLVLVRAFESNLFYDPLISFFKTDHSTSALPKMDTFQLVLNVILRFLINTAISLAILWVLFAKKEIVKVSSFLYGAGLLLLLISFVLFLQSETVGGHFGLFYVRRFLIQPLFLLLLIPAFYFQKKS